ncbi:MAG: UPF0149 family protein [Pseudomonadales bacterium]|nr:UPF0149 family protein [Pseudomonadales bacterium]
MHHPPLQLPNYDELAQKLELEHSLCSPSELHGMLSGLVAGGARLTKAALSKLLEAHLELTDVMSDELAASIFMISRQVQQLLADPDMSFTLMLPDDDEVLSERVLSMASWCSGFLIGLGTALRHIDEKSLSQDVRDAMADIVQISHVDTEDLSEEEEHELMELVEYLRMATVMIFTEFQPHEERQGTGEVS